MDEEKEITEGMTDKVGLTEEQEKELETAIKEQLEKVRDQGLLQGARMVASMVLGYARKNEPYNKRLNNIIRFCNTMMGNTQKRADAIGVNVGFENAKESE